MPNLGNAPPVDKCNQRECLRIECVLIFLIYLHSPTTTTATATTTAAVTATILLLRPRLQVRGQRRRRPIPTPLMLLSLLCSNVILLHLQNYSTEVGKARVLLTMHFSDIPGISVQLASAISTGSAGRTGLRGSWEMRAF